MVLPRLPLPLTRCETVPHILPARNRRSIPCAQASTCLSALQCWCQLKVALRLVSLWGCLPRGAASWGDGRQRSSHNISQGGHAGMCLCAHRCACKWVRGLMHTCTCGDTTVALYPRLCGLCRVGMVPPVCEAHSSGMCGCAQGTEGLAVHVLHILVAQASTILHTHACLPTS
jgi:hypothetical protein